MTSWHGATSRHGESGDAASKVAVRAGARRGDATAGIAWAKAGPWLGTRGRAQLGVARLRAAVASGSGGSCKRGAARRPVTQRQRQALEASRDVGSTAEQRLTAAARLPDQVPKEGEGKQRCLGRVDGEGVAGSTKMVALAVLLGMDGGGCSYDSSSARRSERGAGAGSRARVPTVVRASMDEASEPVLSGVHTPRRSKQKRVPYVAQLTCAQLSLASCDTHQLRAHAGRPFYRAEGTRGAMLPVSGSRTRQPSLASLSLILPVPALIPSAAFISPACISLSVPSGLLSSSVPRPCEGGLRRTHELLDQKRSSARACPWQRTMERMLAPVPWTDC
ncbi:hypothetical protein SETIT_3G061200v2 [Setaria italica]|uniref:Uncharacterized protein n=1 Tax=Setaria italica TaxID=4555 RepID=A0A368QBZ0_SETIT|nr:hypothetical protein SETIT_3G061200v2 [Setaria italica]